MMSCFIDLIKQVRVKRYNARFPEHFSLFRNEFNKFINMRVLMFDSLK